MTYEDQIEKSDWSIWEKVTFSKQNEIFIFIYKFENHFLIFQTNFQISLVTRKIIIIDFRKCFVCFDFNIFEFALEMVSDLEF